MGELVQLKRSTGGAGARDTHSTGRPTSDLDMTTIRDRLGAAKGKEYWRSLEELSNTEAFQEWLHREFPSQASEWTDAVGRRKFLKLMGASLALAGLTACTRQPKERIAPYVRQPEEIVPGKPLFFATAMTLDGVATGLLVENHEGRPTKVEGNPDHPASLGATDLFSQASVLTLYDPDRSQTLTHLGDIRPWTSFLGSLRPVLAAQRSIRGAGFRILTGTVTSPTLAYQIKTLLAEMPSAKWHQYDPAGADNAREGGRLAFGRYVNTLYRFDRAEVVLSLDSDFLSCGPAHLRYSREFANKRRLDEGKAEMNRLYVVESAMTSTGAKADHRLPLRPSEIEPFARAVAAGLGVAGAQGDTAVNAEYQHWVGALVRDLQQHRGRSIIMAGDYQPPLVHALVQAMNQALGNFGNTVVHTDPIEANPVDGLASLRELVSDIDSGQVDLLLILGSNPVYTAPADLNFADRLEKVPLRIHLSLYKDETSERCQWHIAEAHYLESWSDARAYDGTVSIVQPLISPLYRGKTAHEVLAAFSDQPERTSYEIVRDYWRSQMGAVRSGGALAGTTASEALASQAAAAGAQSNRSRQARASEGRPAVRTSAESGAGTTAETGTPAVQSQAATPAPTPSASASFEQFWRRALHDGVIRNTASPVRTFSVAANFAAPAPAVRPAASGSGLEIIFRPDPTIHDGQFANNAWLQELPKPVTTLTWDNVALLSPATAARLGVEFKAGMIGKEIISDQLELQYQGRTITAPALIMAGHADDCVTLFLGYGRTRVGRVGKDLGYNAYALRTSDAPWFGSGLQARKAGGTYPLAVVQLHHLIDVDGLERRDLVRSGTLEEYKHNPGLEKGKGHMEKGHDELHTPSLYPEYEYNGYAWGMAIDLNACVGCNACIVACQAENNIPVVGKEQVARGREMHWLRVDSYFRGPAENPEAYFMPVPCMHCENAPCEVVCPVAATVHSAEGLNDMVYNRCVGTRYCSNNCPYKVRRFNFLLYQDFETASLKMLRNPDVTVRSRGVMEKCTYCVQRISQARIEAEKEDRKVADGEVVTACAAACPAQAIVFGDINDAGSRVAKLKHEARHYALLADLNTQPRTTYLAAVRNPNPELEKA